jgi:hypothetical protein
LITAIALDASAIDTAYFAAVLITWRVERQEWIQGDASHACVGRTRISIDGEIGIVGRGRSASRPVTNDFVAIACGLRGARRTRGRKNDSANPTGTSSILASIILAGALRCRNALDARACTIALRAASFGTRGVHGSRWIGRNAGNTHIFRTGITIVREVHVVIHRDDIARTIADGSLAIASF